MNTLSSVVKYKLYWLSYLLKNRVFIILTSAYTVSSLGSEPVVRKLCPVLHLYYHIYPSNKPNANYVKSSEIAKDPKSFKGYPDLPI